LSKEFAKKNFSNPPFKGRLVVNSLLILSIVLGLSVESTSRNGIMLGIKEWTVTAPVFAGDTITAETEVLTKRVSRSHSTSGIVTVRTKGFKQNRTKVMEFVRSFMVLKTGKKWK
jgi:itaconyl-CoA hydratase